MRHSVLNMRSLRSGPIGSTRAWLPSRRSTLHQIGASLMTRVGHRRSGKLMGWNGRYFLAGSIRISEFLWIGFAAVERDARDRPPGGRLKPDDRSEVAAWHPRRRMSAYADGREGATK